MPSTDPNERERQAVADLARTRGEGDLLGGSLRNTGTARDEPEDRVELWGRRVGRGLGFVVVVILLIVLANTYL